MGRIPDEVVEQVRTRCDIVDVVNARVPLKRAGAAFKACCPFHKEKTPSFNVNPARQIFHCFGCHKGGDVFRFVMEFDHVDFLTAVRMLARQAGVEVPEESADARGRSGPAKDEMLAVHAEVAAFYRLLLLKHKDAGIAREYVKSRNLDGADAEKFGIGFAPDRNDGLILWANQHKRPLELLLAAGLLGKADDGRMYDRFRNRIMFPIRDEQGRVVGFSGRVLRAEDSNAKYLNSPETPIFRKSRILFALDQARNAILEQKQAVLCEGQIDVIRCHLAGITNTVAAQGTAITDEHARVLRRYCDEVVLMLDADTAGENAAVRSAEVLLASGLVVRCAGLPKGDDPDSLILREGPEPVRRALAEAEDIISFRYRMFDHRGEWQSDAGRVRATRALMETIGWANDDALRQQLARRAALLLGVSLEPLLRSASSLKRPAPGRSFSGSESAPPPESGAPAAFSAPPAPEEMALIAALTHDPEHLELIRTYVPLRILRHPSIVRMAQYLLEGGTGSLTALAKSDDPQLARLASAVEMSPLWKSAQNSDVRLKTVRDVILKIWRAEWLRKRQAAQAARGACRGDAAIAMDAQIAELTVQLSAFSRGWDAAQPILDLEC